MDNLQHPKRRFLYFYFNREDPETLRQAIPAHIEYWEHANPEGYMGGPFADRSGGLITFLAGNVDEAAEIIRHDPFIVDNLLQQKWIKEWLPETTKTAFKR